MIHAFGDCELDLGLFQLRVRGEPVRVEPKVFDTLHFLLRHRDRVVTKDELLSGVWSGEAVSESVLPHCIAAARRALGDDRTAQRVIRTVHGRGYRFVADVTTREEAGEASLAARRPRGSAPPRERTIFVGREAALAQLRTGLEAALEGSGATLLLVGEPGIGKTRTAQELAREAEARGARVVWGRCVEAEGAPAFWPWTQILRAFGSDPFAAPDVGASGPEAEQARFRIFDQVAVRLAESAKEQPLVLVLDDLHWADPPSLRLLEFLAPELAAARILLVATFRDVEMRRGHPLARVLGALAREPSCERVVLRGLAPDEIARWVEVATGRSDATDLVASVHEMTEGNPFFVQELLRVVAADGGGSASPRGRAELLLPQSVRDAIGRRLDALTPACNEMLRAASVLGRAFGSRELGLLLGEPPEALLERLAEATGAGILAESEEGLGRFAFRHALLRQTLYEELATPRRVVLHRAAGLALEAVYAEEPEAELTARAHHFYEAAPGGEAERAVDYARRAAALAQRRCAFEEAARQILRALEAEALLPSRDEIRHGELLLALGEAQSAAGERDLSRESFVRAAAQARRRGDAPALARAALGYKGYVDMGFGDGALPILEEALAATGDAHPGWRARVLSRLVGTPPHSCSMAKRRALAEEAYALAQITGDPVVLADALNARYWSLLGPDRPLERLSVADELEALAARTGDRRSLVLAGECRFGVHLVLGNADGVNAGLTLWERAATASQQPGYVFLAAVARSSWALTQGRFAEAEAILSAAMQKGARTVHFAPLLQLGQTFWMRYLRGDPRGLEDAPALVRGLSALPGFESIARAAELAVHLHGRDASVARHAFDALAASRFDDLEHDEGWLLVMGVLTDAAILLEDGDRAREIIRHLEPYGDLMLGHELVRAVSGTAATSIGALHALVGEYDEAEPCLLRGIARAEGLGARPALLSARATYARALELRGRAKDRARARAAREAATAEADALGIALAGRHPWISSGPT